MYRDDFDRVVIAFTPLFGPRGVSFSDDKRREKEQTCRGTVPFTVPFLNRRLAATGYLQSKKRANSDLLPSPDKGSLLHRLMSPPTDAK